MCESVFHISPFSLFLCKFISLITRYSSPFPFPFSHLSSLFSFSLFYPTFFLTYFLHFPIYSTFTHSFSLSQLCKLLLFFSVKWQCWVLNCCCCSSWWTSLLLLPLILECFNFPFPKYFKTLLCYGSLASFIYPHFFQFQDEITTPTQHIFSG